MIGFPFDSVVSFDEHGYPIFDRAVSSKPLKALIGKLFTTGVMPNPSNNLQVFANEEGMTVTVKAGFCVIEGGLKLEDTDRTLEIQASDTTYDRIDTVVMRWNGNDNARICDLYVLEGTPAASPVRPELTREGSIYEIGLADIFIPRNTSVIAQQRITDTRLDTDRCGIVSSISEFDTSTLYAQIQADLTEFKDVEEADFLIWYNAIKDRIDAITAEVLQEQIDDIVEDVSDIQDKIGDLTIVNAGNPLTFTTDSAQVAQNTVITFEPIQAGSGDPSPSNVRPISGYNSADVVVSKKNLVSEIVPSVAWGGNGVVNSNTSYNAAIGRVVKGETYTVTTDIISSESVILGFFYDKPKVGSVTYNSGHYDGPQTFTAPITGYVGIRTSSTYTTPQLELGSTATEYEAPNILTDISEPFPSTVYGGTLDVESGELVVTHKAVDMGVLGWNYNSGNAYFYIILSDKKNGSTNLICEVYKTGDGDLSIAGSSGSGNVYVFDSNYNNSTKSQFIASVTGKKIVYELATPITIHLTPHQVRLLQGANVVASNGVSISLTYRNGEVAKLEDLSDIGESINALSDKASAIDAIVNVNGSKNRVRYPYQETSKVFRGITYTDNGDGVIHANGTNNDANHYSSTFGILQATTFSLKKGRYKISGCPKGGGSGNYYIIIGWNNGTKIAYDYGDGVEVTIDEDTDLGMAIYIVYGTSIDADFKPMICDARIKDDTWAPPAMTNRELTERVNANDLQTFVDISPYTSANPYKAPSDGYFMIGAMGSSGFIKANILGAKARNGITISANVPNGSSNKWGTNSVFVKKGMLLFPDSDTTAQNTLYRFVAL